MKSHPDYKTKSDIFLEIFGLILGLIFIGMTLYTTQNMSEEDRTNFIIMMQLMGNQE